MNGENIMRALTDIDDRLVAEAADEDHIRNFFRNIADEKTENHSDKKKNVKKRFKKILLAAIISILIIAIGVTVSGYIFNFDFEHEVYELFNDHIKLNLDEIDNTADSFSIQSSDLANELANNGISPVMLPAALLTDEWEIEKIDYQFENVFTAAGIYFRNGDIILGLNIVQYTEKCYMSGGDIHQPQEGTQLQINGIDVFVFDLLREPYAKYFIGTTSYSISTNCDYETLIEIAKTIQ